MKRTIAAIACLGLSACSQTLPVRGLVEQTNEPFVGTASGDILGNGSLTITMNSGVTCESRFKSRVAMGSTPVSSKGSFNCSDGRTGTFFYSGTVNAGNGFGTLSDGHKFTFIYGG